MAKAEDSVSDCKADERMPLCQISAINTKKSPLLTEALEHQTYGPDNLPIKDGKLDDIADAGTYPIAYRFPIRGGRPGAVELEGI